MHSLLHKDAVFYTTSEVSDLTPVVSIAHAAAAHTPAKLKLDLVHNTWCIAALPLKIDPGTSRWLLLSSLFGLSASKFSMCSQSSLCSCKYSKHAKRPKAWAGTQHTVLSIPTQLPKQSQSQAHVQGQRHMLCSRWKFLQNYQILYLSKELL